jgi:hypothetical protein
MILDSVLGAAKGILSGGALGVLGAVGSGALDYFKTKESNKQELLVMAAQREAAITAASSATAMEGLKLIAASYEQDKATYIGAGWQDSVRAMIRPVLLAILLITSVFLAIWSTMKIKLEIAIISEIAKYSVYTCLDLTAMGISWYFGSRQMEKINRNLSTSKGKK